MQWKFIMSWLFHSNGKGRKKDFITLFVDPNFYTSADLVEPEENSTWHGLKYWTFELETLEMQKKHEIRYRCTLN